MMSNGLPVSYVSAWWGPAPARRFNSKVPGVDPWDGDRRVAATSAGADADDELLLKRSSESEGPASMTCPPSQSNRSLRDAVRDKTSRALSKQVGGDVMEKQIKE
ncbi:hypothetical protein ACJRO7_030343 [Eucalyptus globulus]|uniref:Uncharacterized protein n=1 Tax=Eucalyptus globulus TaxID=34317 RepID=A0ABD3JIP1_EUCGL